MKPADNDPIRIEDAPAVSLLIPTWRSIGFIASTLSQARAQTWPNLRVMVSVDDCDDGTAEACLAQAAVDPRLDVLVQPQRLGWVGNVNALFDRVQTPYFSLYFHDDRLSPDYVSRLMQVLLADADAASVHCDMGHFGASEHVSRGVDYPYDLARRLAWFLVAPNRGSPLRSLTRKRVLDEGARLPTTAVEGLWANEPYLLELMAAGPARYLPETLYWRWDKREGGLTAGWKLLEFTQQVSAYRSNADAFFATIARAGLAPDVHEALRLCVRFCVVARVRAVEAEYGRTLPLHASEIHPEFAGPVDLGMLAVLGPEIEAWAVKRAEKGASPTANPAHAG